MTEEIDIQQVIKDNLTRIRGIVRDCSTKSVVWCAIYQHRLGFPHPELSSPAKQINLLLGLMLEAKETNEPIDFTPEKWLNIIGPLEMLSQVYALKYLSIEGEPAAMPEPWREKVLVAMTAFFDYHETGLLASTEQVIDRIKVYLSPFDNHLRQILGISASEALDIAQYICNLLQYQLNQIKKHAPSQHSSPDSSSNFVKAVDSFGTISQADLIEQFGLTAKIFWNTFSIARGQGPEVKYPTEPNIVETKPIIRLSEDAAVLFNANVLFTAILTILEQTLTNGPIREKYFRSRDYTPEEQIVTEFSRMLGNNVEVFRNVFETTDNQHEHDIIILTENICLFVEAKASPPDEPFRDPEKAFVRLQRKFHSNKGIQKSYEQSLRLVHLLRRSELILFNKRGEEVLRLPSSIAEKAFCVSVSRDSYGPLAAYLSSMLEKGDDDPYPWAVNILDLGQISDIWQCFQWDDRHLRNFLSQRITLHEKVYSDDELNYVAAYVKHCGLQHFANADCDWLQLMSLYESLLSSLYYHMHHGHPPVAIDPIYPTADYFNPAIKAGKPVAIDNLPKGAIEVGRNEQCPCGSGVKFKRCHGQ